MQMSIGKSSIIITLIQHKTVQVYIKIKLVKRIGNIFIFDSFLQVQKVDFALHLLFKKIYLIILCILQVSKYQ